MKPPTNEQIKEWATSHLCNVHGLDPDSPVLEEGFLLSRAHFVTGVLKAIEFFEGQRQKTLIVHGEYQVESKLLETVIEYPDIDPNTKIRLDTEN